jgi:hypothetical protein
MPRYLKLIARFANGGLALLFFALTLSFLSDGKVGGAFFTLAVGALFAFNLYLIEKAAMALSEEEWLKAEVRKALLRRKLRSMAKEDKAGAIPPDTEQTQ